MSGSFPVVDKPRFRICISSMRQEHATPPPYPKRAPARNRAHTFALAYPSLIVMFRTSSFLNLTVMTPDIAFTTVDLPCATCPIVPASDYEQIAPLSITSDAHQDLWWPEDIAEKRERKVRAIRTHLF